jgi:hypothetical protein
MSKPRDVARAIHLAEVLWVGSWLALGLLVLVGLNTTLSTSHGELNTWQLIFGILPF